MRLHTISEAVLFSSLLLLGSALPAADKASAPAAKVLLDKVVCTIGGQSTLDALTGYSFHVPYVFPSVYLYIIFANSPKLIPQHDAHTKL